MLKTIAKSRTSSSKKLLSKKKSKSFTISNPLMRMRNKKMTKETTLRSPRKRHKALLLLKIRKVLLKMSKATVSITIG
jgi:hypothetical protein